MEATATKESWNPASSNVYGFHARRTSELNGAASGKSLTATKIVWANKPALPKPRLSTRWIGDGQTSGNQFGHFAREGVRLLLDIDHPQRVFALRLPPHAGAADGHPIQLDQRARGPVRLAPPQRWGQVRIRVTFAAFAA